MVQMRRERPRGREGTAALRRGKRGGGGGDFPWVGEVEGYMKWGRGNQDYCKDTDPPKQREQGVQMPCLEDVLYALRATIIPGVFARMRRTRRKNTCLDTC